MKNAVIYARFSSHAQNEQSIEGQLHVCYEYAEREGYTVIGEYIDRALTGTTDRRPDFLRMIDEAKHKQFQYVIVYKLDRFARNRYDSAIYKRKLKQFGVKVLSAMENIGDNPEGILLEALLEASAEYYSVDLSQKIKRGRRESAGKGKFVGGSVPIGYKAIGGQLVVDEETAPIVQEAFRLYADGVPKKEIVAGMNARGLRNRAGAEYGLTAFQTALTNQKYIGVLKQGNVVVEGGCPALVDKETFDRVQERIKLNKRTAGAQKAKVEYLLSGKVFCGMCGAAMLGVSGKGSHGDMHYYYTCGNRKRRQGCTKQHEKKDFIEWYVVEQTVEYVLTPDRTEEIARRIVAAYDKEFDDSAVKALEKRIAKYDRMLNEYVEAIPDTPKAARAPLYAKMEEAAAARDDLSVDLAKLRVAAKIRYKESDVAAWLRSFCAGDPLDSDFRQRIIDVFVNSVYLYDDKVVIWYNIRGGKQVSYMETIDAVDVLAAPDTDPESSYSKCCVPPKKCQANFRGNDLLSRLDVRIGIRSIRKRHHHFRWCLFRRVLIDSITYYVIISHLPSKIYNNW